MARLYCGKHGWHEGNSCFQCVIARTIEKKLPDIYRQRQKAKEERKALKEKQNLRREQNELA